MKAQFNLDLLKSRTTRESIRISDRLLTKSTLLHMPHIHRFLSVLLDNSIIGDNDISTKDNFVSVATRFIGTDHYKLFCNPGFAKMISNIHTAADQELKMFEFSGWPIIAFANTHSVNVNRPYNPTAIWELIDFVRSHAAEYVAEHCRRSGLVEEVDVYLNLIPEQFQERNELLFTRLQVAAAREYRQLFSVADQPNPGSNVPLNHPPLFLKDQKPTMSSTQPHKKQKLQQVTHKPSTAYNGWFFLAGLGVGFITAKLISKPKK